MSNYDLDLARRFFEAKMIFTTGTHELDYLVQRGGDFVVVDVRLPSDYAKGHIPGAVNLPKGKWDTAKNSATASRSFSLPTDTARAVVFQSGSSAKFVGRFGLG
ncbi:MAG: rhodanese-like domain-containing protein [Gammaproteobacteria bacterium]